MDARGGQLLLLISQPRSGSTLLQHILASHSDVHTLPEPWLMLHPLYALRDSGLQAEYGQRYARLAFREFLGHLPDGEQAYIDAVRTMALGLYQQALEPSGKNFYLDKTPRYYFIIPELRRVFPEAKIVLLVRNPLAVLSSIVDVNLGGDARRLAQEDRRHDILTAPGLMREAMQDLEGPMAVVRYEQLVAEPERTVRDMCEQIDLPFEPTMLQYGDKVKFEGTTWVDPKSIYRHDRPVADYADAWRKRINTAQMCHVATSYLQALGRDTIEGLGYDYDEMASQLRSMDRGARVLVVPWRIIIEPAGTRNRRERFALWAISLLRKHFPRIFGEARRQKRAAD